MKKTLSREEQLFMAASELSDKTDREIFLRQACGDDLSLYDRVTDLLAIDAESGNILDETSEGLFEATTTEETIKPGTMIGEYKLLQQIGTGGMGVVFMARQSKPIRRKVAIKVIRFGLDSKNVIARFEAERQALAIMDHPGITRVFDAGTTSCGRPYFVMELINGMPVTKYCDKNKISPRERVELFLQVCNAVQHAHQKGVIHRDIKPSNILVTHYDGVPVPKIIDFGIAKALDRPLTEKTLFTSYGNMIGTPEYMSPEQAEMSGLDTDVCSDVYSLGVVLFELLTGTTPFYEHKNSGLRKICDAICTQDAELASTRVTRLTDSSDELSGNRRTDAKGLKQFLRGDMDWIIARCLNKDRRERYQTAAALAEDITRYLGGEVVDAAGPSASYRVKKFASRHRAALALAGVIAAALVTTTAISTTFAFRAYNAEQLALQQMDELETANSAALEAKDSIDAALQLAEEQRDRADEALQIVQRQRDEARDNERRIAELERESRSRAELAVSLLNVMNEEQKRKFEQSLESSGDLPRQRLAPSDGVGVNNRPGGGGGYGGGGGGISNGQYGIAADEAQFESLDDANNENRAVADGWFDLNEPYRWLAGLPAPWSGPLANGFAPSREESARPSTYSGQYAVESLEESAGPVWAQAENARLESGEYESGEYESAQVQSLPVRSFPRGQMPESGIPYDAVPEGIAMQDSPQGLNQNPQIAMPANQPEGLQQQWSTPQEVAGGSRPLQSEWYPGYQRGQLDQMEKIDVSLSDAEVDSQVDSAVGSAVVARGGEPSMIAGQQIAQEEATMQLRVLEQQPYTRQAVVNPIEIGVEIPDEAITEMNVLEFKADRELVDISANQIQLTEDGSILIMNPDGSVAMSLLDDSGAYMTPIGLADLDENSLGYVDRILTAVIVTNKSVYGEDAMMLCEPQMMRAQVKMQNYNWVEAEEDLRQCELLLMNNRVSGDPLENTRMLAAIAAAKQDKLEEVRELVRQVREEQVAQDQDWQYGDDYCDSLKDCDPELIQRLFVELESSLSELHVEVVPDFSDVMPEVPQFDVPSRLDGGRESLQDER